MDRTAALYTATPRSAELYTCHPISISIHHRYESSSTLPTFAFAVGLYFGRYFGLYRAYMLKKAAKKFAGRQKWLNFAPHS